MTDRELMQQALEALAIAEAGLADIGDADREPGDDMAWCEARAAQALAAPRQAIEALRKRLAQPNEFNPDWDAMAVMVEEQQRMAKRIEELEARQEQEQGPIFHLRSYGDVTAQQLEARQEPVAWCVYLPSQQCAEYFEDQDDLWMADMVTNNEDAEVTALYTSPQLQQEPGDWSVFNTGAEVASGLSFSEAWEYLTPERLARGWSAVCVVNKDNMPTTSPSAPHSADSADTFCNEPVGEIVPAFAGLTAVSIPVMPPVGTKLYTTPQRREWRGLTDEEAMQIIDTARHGSTSGFGFVRVARAIEAALKERNHG